MTDRDDAYTRALARDHEDPTAWFEQLYAEAADGAAGVPWDRPDASAALVAWAAEQDLSDLRTLVVGCGFGRDAEYLARRGADVVAFDIAPTAVAGAIARHPGTSVEYVTADLLSPPAAWQAAFDLVVESANVQALPEPVRTRAVAATGRFVAPGGRLFVAEFARDDDAVVEPGPPWPFTRAEVERFAGDDLAVVTVESFRPGGGPAAWWRAEFERVGS